MPSLVRAETIIGGRMEGQERANLASFTVPSILFPEARMWQDKDLASFIQIMVIAESL